MEIRGSPSKTKPKVGCPLKIPGIPNSPVVTTIAQPQLRCPCCSHSLEPYHDGQLVGSCFDLVDDLYSSDEFRMYVFKVHRCRSTRIHDWTDCPFLHPGEKARRRNPSKFAYSSELCTEFRKNGKCADRDNCRFAHGVFEMWLHPDRYRTQLCSNGAACKRKVCFFAHSVRQLRWPVDSDSDSTDISETSDLTVAPSDSARLLMLSSLMSALIGIDMFRDGGIEMPDVKWVFDLVDF